MTTTTTTDLIHGQLDLHWRGQLRPRLAGLTDLEYFWEPAPGSWNVRPRGDKGAEIQGGVGDFVIDWALEEPDPPPVTTIAWRLGHVIVGVLGARNASHFDGPPCDYLGWEYAVSAAAALDQLDAAYDRWSTGVQGLGDDELKQPCGSAEGQWADRSMAELALHINREVIHHGAEIALLRDLHAHRS